MTSPRRLAQTLFAAVLLLLTTKPGHTQHVDILIARDGEQLVTGSFDFGSGQAAAPVRVFERGFELELEGAVSGNDPGFNALNAPPSPFESLPPNESVTINVRAADPVPRLAYWDGEGTPELGDPPDGTRFEVALPGVLGNIAELTVTAKSSSTTGFEFATTDPNGALHQHVQFTLGRDEDGDGPSAGVYVIPLSLRVDGLQPASLLLVMPHGVDEDRAQQMVDHLNAGDTPSAGGCTFVSTAVPTAGHERQRAPSSQLLLLALVATGAIRRSRGKVS